MIDITVGFNRNEQSVTTRPSVGMPEIDGQLLLETLVSDLHWSALHIGAIACLMTACSRTEPEWTLRPWRHVLRDNGHVMQLGLRYCRDIGLSNAVESKIDKLYSDLAEAQQLSKVIIESTASYRGSQRPLLAQLTERWRHLSQSAIDALSSVESETRQRLDVLYSENARILATFLREAVDGRIHRISPWGEISLPPLPQRRRTPRLALRQQITLTVAGRTVHAALHDVSRNGLGISCNHPLREREVVLVELKDRRCLKAVVVWRNDDRFGLRLEVPLPGNDPLFAATA